LVRDGVSADEVTPEKLAEYLYHPEIPAVDFIVRTSGEQRLSNFMLWRAAYAELYFTPVHWPAFTEDDLDAALEEYRARQRRFGS
jgi:undecaprenyl diphosphate synthase